MRFTLLAVVAGLGIGVLAGGRRRFLAGRGLRLWPLLAAGVAAQLVGAGVDEGPAAALLLGSFACLLAFALANVHTVGMWMVALGIALNLAVIALNGAMPVRASALEAAGLTGRRGAAGVELAARHRLERPGDRLPLLGDVLPVAALREVLSFGDVVTAVGAADVAAHLLAPFPGRRSRRTDSEQVETARSPG